MTDETKIIKSEILNIRLTSEEKLMVQLAAEKLGMTITDFVRLMAVNNAKTIAGGKVEEVLTSFGGTATEVASRLTRVEPIKFTVHYEGENVVNTT